jgi:hypothetical protein
VEQPPHRDEDDRVQPDGEEGEDRPGTGDDVAPDDRPGLRERARGNREDENGRRTDRGDDERQRRPRPHYERADDAGGGDEAR